MGLTNVTRQEKVPHLMTTPLRHSEAGFSYDLQEFPSIKRGFSLRIITVS